MAIRYLVFSAYVLPCRLVFSLNLPTPCAHTHSKTESEVGAESKSSLQKPRIPRKKASTNAVALADGEQLANGEAAGRGTTDMKRVSSRASEGGGGSEIICTEKGTDNGDKASRRQEDENHDRRGQEHGQPSPRSDGGGRAEPKIKGRGERVLETPEKQEKPRKQDKADKSEKWRKNGKIKPDESGKSEKQGDEAKSSSRKRVSAETYGARCPSKNYMGGDAPERPSKKSSQKKNQAGEKEVVKKRGQGTGKRKRTLKVECGGAEAADRSLEMDSDEDGHADGTTAKKDPSAASAGRKRKRGSSSRDAKNRGRDGAQDEDDGNDNHEALAGGESRDDDGASSLCESGDEDDHEAFEPDSDDDDDEETHVKRSQRTPSKTKAKGRKRSTAKSPARNGEDDDDGGGESGKKPQRKRTPRAKAKKNPPSSAAKKREKFKGWMCPRCGTNFKSLDGAA